MKSKKVIVVGSRKNWDIILTENGKPIKLLDSKISDKYTAERCASTWKRDIKKIKLK